MRIGIRFYDNDFWATFCAVLEHIGDLFNHGSLSFTDKQSIVDYVNFGDLLIFFWVYWNWSGFKC
jgi:hypothetical protein